MSKIEASPYALKRGSELSRAPLVSSTATRLGAAPDEVFAFVTDFARLPEWMPLMKRCEVDNARAESPGGVGAVRVIDSGFGKPTEETVYALEPSRLLCYGASDASLRGMFKSHRGVLTTEPHPDGGTWLSWLSYAERGKPPMGWFGGPVFGYVIGTSVRNLERRFPV